MSVVHWGNEQFECLPQRALWWPRRQTLCIADTHLGKAATFRAAGIGVPEAPTTADLDRLSMLLRQTGAQRLVILGDLLHARQGRCDATMSAVHDWRLSHPRLDILLIRGNHDRRAGDPPAYWRFRIGDPVFADPSDADIAFAHEPELVPGSESRRVLCGHLHPAAVLRGAARSIKAPCFWFGPARGVLPAFGSFTGTLAVRPSRGDAVLVIGDGQVVDVSPNRAPITAAATPAVHIRSAHRTDLGSDHAHPR